MQEPEIRNEYKYTTVEKPEDYEHKNAYYGIFMHPNPGIEFVLSYVKSMRKQCDEQRAIKEQIREELKECERQVDNNMDDFEKMVVKNIQKYWTLIRTDFLNHQSKKMDMQNKCKH